MTVGLTLKPLIFFVKSGIESNMIHPQSNYNFFKFKLIEEKNVFFDSKTQLKRKIIFHRWTFHHYLWYNFCLAVIPHWRQTLMQYHLAAKKGIDVCFVSRNFHQKGVKGCFHETRSLQHNRLRTSTQLVGTYIIYYTKRWKIIINCIQILLAITYQKMCKIILKFKIPWWNNCCSCA